MVGSSLVRTLQSRGYTNLLVRTHDELDLRRQTETETFFEKERPEYVFLAAARVGGILANDTYKGDFIYDNIMIAANVISASYKSGASKLLNYGSSCIYPKLAPQPIKEDMLLTGTLEPTNEPYAIAKISALKLCRYFNEQYGTDFISVMPTNLYGPYDNFNLETAHVLPALIRKMHLASLLSSRDYDGIARDLCKCPIGFNLTAERDFADENSMKDNLRGLGISEISVMVWGSGEVYREFLHVDDLSEACIFMMENYGYRDMGEIVNIGSGQDIKIRDLAALVKETVGFGGELRYDASRPDGTPRKLLDVSFMKERGWAPKIPLASGIEKTYGWYRAR
jgi:GDP-L-fucose synthase